jgi:hypothetical protein
MKYYVGFLTQWIREIDTFSNTVPREVSKLPSRCQCGLQSKNKASQQMIDKIQKAQVKNEMKFWYTKETYLNKVLYNLHSENGHEWNNLW